MMDYEIFDAMPEGAIISGKAGFGAKGKSKYPFAQMKVGQVSFFPIKQGTIASAAYNAGRLAGGWKFSAKTGTHQGVAGTWVERTE